MNIKLCSGSGGRRLPCHALPFDMFMRLSRGPYLLPVTRLEADARTALPGENSLSLPLPQHKINPDVKQQGHHEGKVEGYHRGVDDKIRVRYGTDTGITWRGREQERKRKSTCLEHLCSSGTTGIL